MLEHRILICAPRPILGIIISNCMRDDNINMDNYYFHVDEGVNDAFRLAGRRFSAAYFHDAVGAGTRNYLHSRLARGPNGNSIVRIFN